MELRNLITFTRIVELNHFTKAAESLGYSQTAVSVQIKNLEKELGTRLFDRVGRGVQLTEAGRRFYPHALEVIRAMESAAGSVNESMVPSGEIRIGATSSLAEEMMTDISVDYVTKYPDVIFSVIVINETEPLMDALRTGAIDIAYYMDERIETRNCEKIYEKEEPVVFVTHRDNRIASYMNLTLQDISAEPIVISERETNYFSLIADALHQNGVELHPSITIGSVSGIIRIISHGFGVAYIPRFMVEKQLAEGSLVELKVSDARKFSVFGQIFIRKNKWISPAMREFIKIIY